MSNFSQFTPFVIDEVREEGLGAKASKENLKTFKHLLDIIRIYL